MTHPPVNGVVEKANEVSEAFDPEAVKRSVQVIPPGQGPFTRDAGGLFFLASMADEFIEWGTNIKGRDMQLRSFIPKEHRFLSALGIVSAANAAFSWKITGPEKRAAEFQKKLQQSNFGEGWASLMSQVTTDLSTQDQGAFIEIIRKANRPDADFVGLAHMDAARCYPTGIPETPVWYQDRMGQYHIMNWWQVIHIRDMPGTVEGLPGIQYCALTRLLIACRTIRDISIYLQEKVGGRNSRAVTLVKGVNAGSIAEAWDAARIRHDAAGFYRFSMPLLLSSVSPEADIGFETLEIASLPDGFDLDLSEKQYIAQLAMAFMRDYQDFAPLPGGNLGTSQQSEILDQKSKGKGPGLFMKLISEAINFKILPGDLEFEFDEQDVTEDKQEAEVSKLRGEDRVARIGSGELTKEVARMIALRQGDLTQEEFDELERQAEEEAALQAEQDQMALDQQIAGELNAPATIEEEGSPEAQLEGGVPVEEGDGSGFGAKESDDRAGPPRVEQERIDTEQAVTDAIEGALALARERFGRALGIPIDVA